MSLEATMLVLDNSYHSINGDYAPTRLEAQSDAVHVLFNSKLNANPENEVGLMVMAGKGPEVLTTLTQDEGKLIAAMHDIKRGGEADLQTGIQVAQLALKHRQNKNQRQRIIVFVGSPIKDTQAALVKLGKKMKKNNVALDIISFGSTPDVDLSIPSLIASSSSSTPFGTTASSASTETNETKLSALIDATNSSDNSHFLAVEPGPHLLSERIMQSPIARGEGFGHDDDAGMGTATGSGAGGDQADEFGVDPNLDPELAMALRMSLQEEQARQAAASASTSTSAAAALEPVPEGVSTQITDPTKAGAEPTGADLTSARPPTASETFVKPDNEVQMLSSREDVVGRVGAEAEDDEDEELRRALALSQQEGGATGEVEDVDVDMGDEVGMDEDEDEDIARAIALSMQDADNDSKDAKE